MKLDMSSFRPLIDQQKFIGCSLTDRINLLLFQMSLVHHITWPVITSRDGFIGQMELFLVFNILTIMVETYRTFEGKRFLIRLD